MRFFARRRATTGADQPTAPETTVLIASSITRADVRRHRFLAFSGMDPMHREGFNAPYRATSEKGPSREIARSVEWQTQTNSNVVEHLTESGDDNGACAARFSVPLPFQQ